MEYVDEEIEIRPQQAIRVDPVLPLYAIILVSCIVVVSIVQIVTGLSESVLIGGFVKPLFVKGQYWRILTSAALHGGLLHLAFNSYALYVLGRLIEMLSNRAHLAIVFVLSIIGGGLMSLAFGPDAPSVGASGGIIGFLGYLTVYGFKRRQLLSNSFLKNMLFNIGLIAVFGIFIMPNVDNFAHLGGLLVGAVYGFIEIPANLHTDPRTVDKAMRIAGYAAMGIYILTAVFTILLLTGAVRFDNSFI